MSLGFLQRLHLAFLLIRLVLHIASRIHIQRARVHKPCDASKSRVLSRESTVSSCYEKL